MTKTEAVICYLLAKAAPHPINKTTLIKLCYFADLESVRRSGEPITGQTWERGQYGAVAYDIPNTARKIPGVQIDDHPTPTGNLRTDFSAGLGLPDPEYDLSVSEMVVLDDIFEKCSRQYARTLGDQTKTTEPWVNAVAADSKVLNLSVVAPADPAAYSKKVLARIDRSQRGTAAEIAARDAEVERWMCPHRAIG